MEIVIFLFLLYCILEELIQFISYLFGFFILYFKREGDLYYRLRNRNLQSKKDQTVGFIAVIIRLVGYIAIFKLCF